MCKSYVSPALWVTTIISSLFYVPEKARIEAQVKAAEAAVQLRIQEKTRMKREQEREAARVALHMVLPACYSPVRKFPTLDGWLCLCDMLPPSVQMKKTVDIDNSDFLKDLENFCQKWQANPPCKLIMDFVNGIESPSDLHSPLEALGLFMKKDEEEIEHEMDNSISSSLDADVEDGEISCSQ
jgi:hypothetical protein